MMSPPFPPSPPSGPPLGTNFSRRKLTQPLPPSPALAWILIWSTNMVLNCGLGIRIRESEIRNLAARLYLNRSGELLVQALRLSSDRPPAELFDGSLTSSLPELSPELRVGYQDIDFLRQIASELIRFDRLKRAL